MNRLYLITPLVLLALFAGVYWRHSNAVSAEAAQKAAAVAAAQAEEAARQAELARAAQADAEQRAALRLAEEQKAEADRRARHEEDNRRLAEDSAQLAALVTTLGAESAALERQLADLRDRRKALNTEGFALAKDVELARVAKRNAELELQRLTEMVARQAGNTSLARSPQ
jgi:hypothetical protein